LLADGSSVTYWYAWKSGPRLRGKPGTSEFITSYNEDCAQKKAPPRGQLQRILNEYQDSSDFTIWRSGRAMTMSGRSS
jgi:hypothetical protein